MSYWLLYSETSRMQIRKLHPRIKSAVKSKIEKLQENPFSGKWLERELSGYLSMRAKRFRVIYSLNPSTSQFLNFYLLNLPAAEPTSTDPAPYTLHLIPFFHPPVPYALCRKPLSFLLLPLIFFLSHFPFTFFLFYQPNKPNKLLVLPNFLTSPLLNFYPLSASAPRNPQRLSRPMFYHTKNSIPELDRC